MRNARAHKIQWSGPIPLLWFSHTNYQRYRYRHSHIQLRTTNTNREIPILCAYANHYSQTECSFASNIVTQCCNIDVQVYSEHISQTLLYKITGKFVPQACNICISNFQINSKRYLACELIGKRVCSQL